MLGGQCTLNEFEPISIRNVLHYLVACLDVPETTGAIREAAVEVGGAARDIGALREDLRRLTRDVAAASRDLGRLARYLEENPNALLSGKDGGGGER